MPQRDYAQVTHPASFFTVWLGVEVINIHEGAWGQGCRKGGMSSRSVSRVFELITLVGSFWMSCQFEAGETMTAAFLTWHESAALINFLFHDRCLYKY